jgi:hypothetical protein
LKIYNINIINIVNINNMPLASESAAPSVQYSTVGSFLGMMWIQIVKKNPELGIIQDDNYVHMILNCRTKEQQDNILQMYLNRNQ